MAGCRAIVRLYSYQSMALSLLVESNDGVATPGLSTLPALACSPVGGGKKPRNLFDATKNFRVVLEVDGSDRLRRAFLGRLFKNPDDQLRSPVLKLRARSRPNSEFFRLRANVPVCWLNHGKSFVCED